MIEKFKSIINGRGRNENTELTKYWKSTSVAGPGWSDRDKEIQLWIDWLVRNGELAQGALKSTDLYTNEFNPYSNGTYPSDSGSNGQALGPAK